MEQGSKHNQYVNGLTENTNRQDEYFQIYPNPARDYFTVLSAEIAVLEFYSIRGEIVTTYQRQAGRNTVFIEGMVPGLYMIKIYNNSAAFFEILCVE